MKVQIKEIYATNAQHEEDSYNVADDMLLNVCLFNSFAQLRLSGKRLTWKDDYQIPSLSVFLTDILEFDLQNVVIIHIFHSHNTFY